MKKPDLSRFAPPGANWEAFRRTAGLLLLGSFLISGILFIAWLFDLILNITADGVPMPDFCLLPKYIFLPFLISALCLLAFAIYFYTCFHQGSKTVYLMRRLPKRGEMAIRCLTLPLSGVVLCLLLALVMLLLYFGIYMMSVPDQFLTPDQWQKLWRSIL